MKKIVLFLAFILCQNINCQTFSTNLTPVGWEHNILFNATTRYTVTQQGPIVNLPVLFDGSMNTYHFSGVTPENPLVILIEGLVGRHTQAGAWVGWTTRSLPASRFKIEGYDTYNAANVWRTISDYSALDYNKSNFSTAVPVPGVYTKLKFTFYNGPAGNVGLSELFFIHPEATTPYAGLLTQSNTNWQNSDANLFYNLGNVGIGTTITGPHKLAVEGSIGAREVKVTATGWPDYVFKNNYNLPTLEEVEKHINEKGHLENIPSEEEVLKNGISLGEMNAKLLQKIEELTLYMIDVSKKVNDLTISNDKLIEENKILFKKAGNLKKR